MARIVMAPESDSTRRQATELAHAFGAVIEMKPVTVNAVSTALATVLGAVLLRSDDAEFESALGCFAEAVRVNRASLQEPPREEMN
jgi:hypothetical protein